MAKQVKSILILDKKNRYSDTSLTDKKIKITSIEREQNHELGLKTLKKVQPDILIKVIDDEDGYTFNDTVDFLSNAKKISGRTQMLVVNADSNKEQLYQLIDLGVSGVHDGKSPSLLTVLSQLNQYQSYLSSSYQQAILDKLQQTPPKQVNLSINHPKARKVLTGREIEVLEDLVTNAGTYEDRGKRLFISPKTLKNHMVRIMDKLEAENRTHIIGRAIKKGIIDMVSK